NCMQLLTGSRAHNSSEFSCALEKYFSQSVLSAGSGEKLGPNLQGTGTHRVRMTLSCLVFLGLSPVLVEAQSTTSETVPSSTESSAKVSVRALQIPRKAHDAFKK